MKRWIRKLSILGIGVAMGLSTIRASAAFEHHLYPVTWKGKKWEYLVEFPTDIQHISPERFEEILDSAGQHGWKLVSVTSTMHFYAFYFTRPIASDAKLAEIRKRLLLQKAIRAEDEASKVHQILDAQQEKLANEQKYAAEVERVNRDLQREAQLEQQLLKEQQQLQVQKPTPISKGPLQVPLTPQNAK